MKKTLFFASICYLMVTCSPTPEPLFKAREDNSGVTTIRLLDEKTAAATPDSLIEGLRYIKLETNKNSLISNYTKILACGDTLFILDKSMSQQCIFAFNFKGKFLFKIDALGNGPQEYKEISDFYVDCQSKHIGILNWSNISKYDFEGEFIGSLNLQHYNIQRIQCRNNRLYAYKIPDCRTEKCFAFAAFDLDGNLLYEDYPERKEILSYGFVKSNYFASNSEKTYLNLLNSDTIYEVGANSLHPKFVLDFGKIKLPEADFEKLLNRDFDYAFDYFRKNNLPSFGLSKFKISDNYLWLVSSGPQEAYTTIYSLKSGQKKMYNNRYPSKEILYPGSSNYLNGDLFYGRVSTPEILQIIKQDEYDGILDPMKNFSKTRTDKYNFIKDTKINDNDIIVLFKIKDF